MQRKAQKPWQRARGYRIQFADRSNPYRLHKLPIIWWPESDGIPPQWEAIKNDPNVVYGRLFRSGRKCEEFRS
jgi:hypothetical protein